MVLYTWVNWRSRDSSTYSEGNTRLGRSSVSMRAHLRAHREVEVPPAIHGNPSGAVVLCVAFS